MVLDKQKWRDKTQNTFIKSFEIDTLGTRDINSDLKHIQEVLLMIEHAPKDIFSEIRIKEV